MGVPQDDWVDIQPFDEFSVENAANRKHSRGRRLLRVDRENPRFSESK